MVLNCKQCGKEFELADSEIEFYKKKGLELPKRCKACRDENQARKKEQWAASRKDGKKKKTGAETESSVDKSQLRDRQIGAAGRTSQPGTAGKDGGSQKSENNTSQLGSSTGKGQKNNLVEEKGKDRGTVQTAGNKNLPGGDSVNRGTASTAGNRTSQSGNSKGKSAKAVPPGENKNPSGTAAESGKGSVKTAENGQTPKDSAASDTSNQQGGNRNRGKQLVAAVVFLVLAFVVSRFTGSDPAANNGDNVDPVSQAGVTVSIAPTGEPDGNRGIISDGEDTPTPTETADNESTPTPAEAEDGEDTPTPTETADNESTPTPAEAEDGEDTPTPTETADNESTPTPVEAEDEKDAPTPTETAEQEPTPTPEEISSGEEKVEILYYFRRDEYLQQHFEKHGDEFDYETAEQYLEGANRVVQDPAALHKLEAEDGDDIYYLEESNEFVVVSKDGYIRTYFKPSRGIDYYNRQ